MNYVPSRTSGIQREILERCLDTQISAAQVLRAVDRAVQRFPSNSEFGNAAPPLAGALEDVVWQTQNAYRTLARDESGHDYADVPSVLEPIHKAWESSKTAAMLAQALWEVDLGSAIRWTVKLSVDNVRVDAYLAYTSALVFHHAGVAGSEPRSGQLEYLRPLAERIKAKYRDQPLIAPATRAHIAATEALIGMPLPPELAFFYETVANGGFGPGLGGILGAVGGARLDDRILRRLPEGGKALELDREEFEQLDIADVYLQYTASTPRRDPKNIGAKPGDDQWFEAFDDPWPVGMLMLTDYGCSAWSYVEAKTGQVFFTDADLEEAFQPRPLEAVPWREFLQPEAESITSWFEGWLSGVAPPHWHLPREAR